MISDDNSVMPETESDTSSASIQQSPENRALITADRRPAAPDLSLRNNVLPSGAKIARREYFPSNPTAFFEPFELDLVEYPHMESQLFRCKYVSNLTEAQYDQLGGKRPYLDDPLCYDKLKSALLAMGRPLPGREIDALSEGKNFSNLASRALHNRILTKSTASRKQIADDPILHNILLRLFLKYLPHVIATIHASRGSTLICTRLC